MSAKSSRSYTDFDITKDELNRLGDALKNEEFRKLLSEYAEEINDPQNKKQYQDEITQLELERGVECTFINPQPGFVVKTSVDGKKKAFINICKNEHIEKPSSVPMIKENCKGLNWSIPFSQSPPRDDFDKKRNLCVVYDVVFHPDTLHLADKNSQFKKIVVDTALSAVEDSFKVSLDRKNFKFPKINFKGMAHATVLRKKSSKSATLSEEEIREFDEQYGYPFKRLEESDKEPEIKNYDNKKETREKYTQPRYLIKYSSGIDLQEFTFDKNAKLNAVVPKELVIEINVPLLRSAKDLTLDVMEKSLHLISEKPARYKLDLNLAYNVDEESGNAKFDTSSKTLTVTLPVKKSIVNLINLQREDSGVESDFGDRGNSCDDDSPLVSVKETTDHRMVHLQENEDQMTLVTELAEKVKDTLKVCEDYNFEKNFRTTSSEETTFLNPSYHYTFPSFVCNVDNNFLSFVLNVKNCDPNSITKKANESLINFKFSSIGSGFFPIHYAFCVKFDPEFHITEDSFNVEAWDNNVIAQMHVEGNGELSRCYVGVDENSLVEKILETPLQLNKHFEALKVREPDLDQYSLNVIKNENEVIIDVKNNVTQADTLSDCDENINMEVEEFDSSSSGSPRIKNVLPKSRTMSEDNDHELLSPLQRKSILKKRINRSLSESNADDYVWCSSVDTTFTGGSDSCIPEEGESENKHSKKTVRFSDFIKKQTFRVNLSILEQKKKNKKRSWKKRRALERRASESENSEGEDKERDKKSNKNEEDSENGATTENESNEESVIIQEDDVPTNDEFKNTSKRKQKKGKNYSKKGKRNCNFKTDLIFDLDI